MRNIVSYLSHYLTFLKGNNPMDVMVGYEVELASPVDDAGVRKFFNDNDLPVKAGQALNHTGPYHAWGIAVDGSVMPTSRDHHKYELISPVMPLDRSLEVMKLVFDWMAATGGYTNTSTGFHVGVSLADKSFMTKLNRLKLALLLDEVTILKKFGRSQSQWVQLIRPALIQNVGYTFSAYKPVITNFEAWLQERVPASKAYSANLNRLPGWIEFRCMGSNYSARYDECRETILHYAEIVRAAADPEFMKKEYEEKYNSFIHELCTKYPALGIVLKKNETFFKEIVARDTSRRKLRQAAALEVAEYAKEI
jgi:hypothetical protein